MCDDFDDFDGGADCEAKIAELTWKKNIEEVGKTGFRSGIDTGQEESIQQGFDEGFSNAATIAFHVARLRGKVKVFKFLLYSSGKLTYNFMKPGYLSDHQKNTLEQLLGDIVELETQLHCYSSDMLQDMIQAGIKPLTEHETPADVHCDTSCDVTQPPAGELGHKQSASGHLEYSESRKDKPVINSSEECETNNCYMDLEKTVQSVPESFSDSVTSGEPSTKLDRDSGISPPQETETKKAKVLQSYGTFNILKMSHISFLAKLKDLQFKFDELVKK